MLKEKKGNAWVGILLLMTFLLVLGLALVSDSIVTIAQSKKAGQILIAQSLCDAGIEKAIWKLNDTGGNYTGETDLDLDTGVIDIALTGAGESRDVVVTSYVPEKGAGEKTRRTVRAKIMAETNESNVAFNYGVQVGGAGITMSNNAILNGNIYSAGSINCANNAVITGDAFLSKNEAGTYGNLNNCRVNGNSEAYNILGATVSGWAKYVGGRAGSTAGGGFTNITAAQLDADLPYTELPIAQSTVDSWESWAGSGGVFSGSYSLATGQSASLGPKVIDGNLTLASGSTLTLTGVVWVKGNIVLNTGSALRLNPSFGPKGGMIIADNPADRDNSGYIRVQSNVAINGSGDPKSYILMLSTSKKNTTADPAIFAGNNSTAVVYYSTEGMIEVSNNAHLKALTGGGLHLSNGAQVNYDSGLASTNFSGGPGGAWVLKEWQIIHN